MIPAMASLVTLDRRYQAAAAKAEALRAERNAAIRAAVLAGEAPSAVARDLGMTRARVTQIVAAGRSPAG